MDGKVLVLCDEKPGDYGRYSIKDSKFLVSPIKDPEDDPERLFICWDSIIPEDRSFIEACKHYARTLEKPAPDFMLSQKGSTDSASGTIKGSVQEQAYLDRYLSNMDMLTRVKAQGGDVYGEAIEIGMQYPLDANSYFFQEFSRLLNMNGVVRVLPTYSLNTEPNIARYRADMLEAWKMQNQYMGRNKAYAKVVSPMTYSDFGEVYTRAGDELLTVYSLPIFGEERDD